MEKVSQINSDLSGDVRITLKEGGMTKEYSDTLKATFKGEGFRYNDVVAIITEEFSPIDFSIAVLREDPRRLASAKGIERGKAEQIIQCLVSSLKVFDIEKVYCPDYPTFFLRTENTNDSSSKKEKYKETEHLSTGQKCTAVLPIVFAASGNPLVIDQPEDNLDNRYIADSIHRLITAKKEHRQMIFVTHNPNIPVLSWAEYCMFLDYQSKQSHVSSNGTVDDVKESILQLLEGGEEAFNKRRKIYGK